LRVFYSGTDTLATTRFDQIEIFDLKRSSSVSRAQNCFRFQRSGISRRNVVPEATQKVFTLPPGPPLQVADIPDVYAAFREPPGRQAFRVFVALCVSVA